MKESTRFTITVTVALAGILLSGTLGYYTLEDGWSLIDALYMTVITITTVGFGETHDLSPVGRFFTVFLRFGGGGVVGFMGSHAARMIVDTQMKLVRGRGKMEKALEKIRDHYIVCGYGRIGSTICAELSRLEYQFVVIESDEELVKQCEAKSHLVTRDNATTDSALISAGIERAVGVIAVLSDDADNLFISLAARELNPKVLIISRAEQRGVEDRMLRAGADKVVSPLVLGGRQIAKLITEQGGESLSLDLPGELARPGPVLQEFQNTDGRAETVADALRLSGAPLAVAVRREDGTTEMAPGTATRLSRNDCVVLCVNNEPTARIDIGSQTRSAKVMLVDDHRALRMLFAKKLRTAGHDAIVASSGEEAVKLAQETKPELIVLDVQMPGMDGYEVCQIIKETPDLENSRVILYSADETQEFINRGKEAGADQCLRKGSKSSDLLEMIDELLSAA